MQTFYMMMMSVSGLSRSLTCVKTGAETVIAFHPNINPDAVLLSLLLFCGSNTHLHTPNTLRFQGILFCFLFGSE